jgi:hypothetical protein
MINKYKKYWAVFEWENGNKPVSIAMKHISVGPYNNKKGWMPIFESKKAAQDYADVLDTDGGEVFIKHIEIQYPER